MAQAALVRRSDIDGGTVTRTNQGEANGILTLAVHIGIRDQDMVENFVREFVLSAFRKEECILRYCWAPAQ